MSKMKSSEEKAKLPPVGLGTKFPFKSKLAKKQDLNEKLSKKKSGKKFVGKKKK